MSTVVIEWSTNPDKLNDAAYHLPFLKENKKLAMIVILLLGPCTVGMWEV
jgi:hypothetical protein